MANNIIVGARIKQVREEKGFTQEELAKELGLNKSTIQRYETAKIEKIKLPVIEAIAQKLNVNPEWLSDKTDVRASYNGIDSNVGEVMNKDKIRMIPVFESVSAGFGASASEYIVNYIPLYIEHDYDAENTLAIKVIGNSMYPKIEDGDLIAVRRQSDFENGQVVVVLLDGEEGLVKKIYQERNKITLVSFNPEYPDKVFTGEEINRLSIVGVVKQVIKTL